MALLTAVSPLSGETVRGMNKQTIYERNFKVYSQKHETSKAGVKVPLELITVVSVGDCTVAPKRGRKSKSPLPLVSVWLGESITTYQYMQFPSRPKM